MASLLILGHKLCDGRSLPFLNSAELEHRDVHTLGCSRAALGGSSRSPGHDLQ